MPVSEIGMERAEGLQIVEKARIDERVCVPLDHDFHAHLAMTDTAALRWSCCLYRDLTPKGRPS